MTSQMTLSPFFFSKIFDKYFVPVHFPGIFMYLLPLRHFMHRYFSAAAHHSVRCFVSSFFWSTEINLSFGFGLSSSQSFHSSTWQWKLAAYCNAAHTSSFLLHSFRSCFRHKPFVQQCSFCQLTGLLIAFGDELLKIATALSFLSSCDVPLHAPLPPKCPFLQDDAVLPKF